MLDLALLFQEFAASMVRAKDLDTAERLSPWSHAVKERLGRLGKKRGFAPYLTDDWRKSGSFLWDVAWAVEDKVKPGHKPWGAGVAGLQFPNVPYRRLALVAEVEWGRRGQRKDTRNFEKNLEEVFRDFYKLLDARCPARVMVYTSWLYPDQSGPEGLFVRGIREILLGYEAHDPEDGWLLVEFDDVARRLCGYTTQVPSRGPRSFQFRALPEWKYPTRWDPKKEE
jgi:hypothetical protein